jgi:hypothetical protein
VSSHTSVHAHISLLSHLQALGLTNWRTSAALLSFPEYLLNSGTRPAEGTKSLTCSLTLFATNYAPGVGSASNPNQYRHSS